MADSTQTQDQKQDAPQDQQSQSQYPQVQGQQPWDQDFVRMLGGGAGSQSTQPQSHEALQEYARGYFDLAEAVLRNARRATEMQTFSLFRQQIVTEVAATILPQILPQITQQVTAQVISQIKQNPSWLKDSSSSSR